MMNTDPDGQREDAARDDSALQALQLAALNAAANAVVITDRKGTIVWVNPAFTRVTGYEQSEAIGRNPRMLQSGLHDREFYRSLWQTILSGGIWRGEFINRRKDGSLFHDEHTITPVRSESGGVTHFIGILNDVTERRRALDKLRESEEQFRQLAENVDEVFWIATKDHSKLLYVSPAFEVVWRRSCESAYQRPLSFVDAVHPADREQVDRWLEKQKDGEPTECEYRIVQSDGSTRWIQSRSFPVHDSAGQFYRTAGFADDVTERRQLEEQVRQAQKMEAVGQLAGGIAHDFNNILAAVLMNVGLLRTRTDLPGDVMEYLGELEAEMHRATGLTRQLLLFSRRHAADAKALEINAFMRERLPIFQRILGAKAQIAFDPSEDPLWLVADAGMVEQLFVNLCINAREAMPKGGMLTLACSLVIRTQDSPKINPDARPGAFVCLSVTDTGCGMDAGTLKRAFEPFFTTKDVGQGSGLGLSTVYGIVKQHKGWIEAESQLQKGTSFRAYFPTAPQASARARDPSLSLEIQGGSETLLLVEDEVALRRTAALWLRKLGYAVLEAGTAAEALEIWAREQERVGLLVTDVVMPGGMNGLELAERLRQDRSNLPVIAASGYSADFPQLKAAGRATLAYMPKPYRPSALARLVRDCLDGKPVPKQEEEEI
ncbi:MAG: PAS domain S-box protein [Verrucomicrobiota bacterium]